MEFAKVADVMPPQDGKHRDKYGIERHKGDGRPKIYPEGGGKGVFYTRVSTFVDCLEDKSNLSNWKLRQVVKGFSRRPDLIEDYAKINDPDGVGKSKALALAERAMDAADAGMRASAGTEVHTAVESHLRGEEWTLPPDIEDDVTAFVHAFKRMGLKFVDAEVFGINDDLQVGGSCDYILNWDGMYLLADTKTGAPYWSKTAMQVGIYSRCEKYNPFTYERTPLVKLPFTQRISTQQGLFIHLPLGEGRCDIRLLDLNQGWEDALLAQQVREARKRFARKASIPESLVNISSEGVDIAA